MDAVHFNAAFLGLVLEPVTDGKSMPHFCQQELPEQSVLSHSRMGKSEFKVLPCQINAASQWDQSHKWDVQLHCDEQMFEPSFHNKTSPLDCQCVEM